jgi:hypothetical protein
LSSSCVMCRALGRTLTTYPGDKCGLKLCYKGWRQHRTGWRVCAVLLHPPEANGDMNDIACHDAADDTLRKIETLVS